MRFCAWTLAFVCLGSAATAVELDAGGQPGPRCYKKVPVAATYDISKRLVRKARLVHEETETGQVRMLHFPAIYIEEKKLVTPEHVLLQEVRCTKRVLRRAEPLPQKACEATRGCIELEPPSEG